jgi:KaiC/GvpD/RAD55 family RecA-like ATPase
MEGSESVRVRHEPCPVCGSRNNLAIWEYADGSETFWCYTEDPEPCTNRSTKRREEDANFTYYPDRIHPKDVLLNDKPLFSINTLSAYDIRIDREGRTRVMFVYREESGKVIKAKTRNYNLPKADDYHFGQVGKTKVNSLFGKETRRGNKAILVAGEWDAVAAREMTGYTGLSMESGDNGLRCVKADLEYLESFDTLYICFDNDSAGIEGTRKVLELLPMAIPVLLPMLPKEDETYTKDAFDFLKAGYQKEFLQAVQDAKPQTPALILPGEELMTRIRNFVRSPSQSQGWSTGIPGLNDAIGGFRDHEITMLLGDPGKGKSTTARFFIKSALDAGKRILYISLEDIPERAALRFMEMYFDKKVIGEGAQEITDEELLEMGKFYLNNQIQMTDCSSLSPDELTTQVRYAVLQNQASFVVLDHLTMAAEGMEMESDRKAINIFLTRLNSLKKKYPVHFLVISHNHRPAQAKKEDPTGIENDPIPTLRDGLGSGNIERIPDNYLALRMMRSGLIELHILKSRLWENTGKVTLRYRNGKYEQTAVSLSQKGQDAAKHNRVQGSEGKRVREESVDKVPPVEANTPNSPVDSNQDSDSHVLNSRLLVAKRLLSRTERLPIGGLDAEDGSTGGYIPV